VTQIVAKRASQRLSTAIDNVAPLRQNGLPADNNNNNNNNNSNSNCSKLI